MNLSKLLLIFCVTLLGAISAGNAALAQEKIDVATAINLAQNGDALLLDIRTPAEWKKTGVSPLATTLNMHSSSFGEDLMRLINSNRDVPIAVICATGGRSAYLSSLLDDAGFSAVYDVTEGMLGSSAGPGWIAAGLPTIAYNPSR